MQAWDERVLFWINGHHHPLADGVLYPVSYAGEAGGLLLVLFFAVLLDGIPRRAWLHWLPYGVILLLLQRILFEASTILWFRERPYLVLDGVRQMGMPWFTSSFPSGHAHYACLITVMLGARHPRWLWGLIPFTLVTCYARPYFGMHYPSDVLIGALSGLVAGYILLWAQNSWLRHEARLDRDFRRPISPEPLPATRPSGKAKA